VAGRFARAALGHVAREYPNKLDHVMGGPADAQGPRALHPIFFGSFDWHSCVHGWWTLLTLRRMFPQMPEAVQIDALADELFTPANVAAETAYLARPESRGFERPYGWAWLLKLQAELIAHHPRRAEVLAPLAEAFAERFRAFLPIATYPVRTGTHYNTAFALLLALDYAEAAGDAGLRALAFETAVRWYGGDRDCQAWEPSQDEFLSSALTEAALMRRVLAPPAFGRWFGDFLPRLEQGEPASLLTPAEVSDRSDGKIAHLDGLNLSRAWCWRLVGDPRGAAERHLEAALPHVTGDYMGEHWLASFALLALTADAD
ncbi:MAG TPA: DUF2891 domain-containing protein, partial [Caulobacteraceae bacterium]